MQNNHLAIPSTSYSGRSDQFNVELESLRAKNRQLSEALARTRQELSFALENTNDLRNKNSNLHLKYYRLENLVKAKVYELSNFLNEPRPQNPVNQTRNSQSDSMVPTRPKTQKVLPTVNGHVIQVPKITLDRLEYIRLDPNTRTSISNTSLAPAQSLTDVESTSNNSDTEENEALTLQTDNEHLASLTSNENEFENSQLSDHNQEDDLFDSGNTDVAEYLTSLISAQEDVPDEPSSTNPDNMENIQVVLERLPKDLSLGPLPEEPSDLNLNASLESSSTNTDVHLVSQPTSTSLTDMVDSSTGMQQTVAALQLSDPGCSSKSSQDSKIRQTETKKFSSFSQIAAMKMLGLQLTSPPRASTTSPRSRVRRCRKMSSPPRTPPQQKNRKRKLNPKCSSTSIKKSHISNEKIVMVLLDRKEMSKLLLLHNPAVNIRKMLDNKTNMKAESKSTRKKMEARSCNSVVSKTINSDVGSQTEVRPRKKKSKNRKNDVVSEAFIKRNLTVKVTKLKALQ